jgi:hypothetical protein
MRKITEPRAPEVKFQEAPRSLGMSEDEVRASIAFWDRQPLVWITHLTMLPILLLFLWGLREPVRLMVWSATALSYAAYIWWKGWIPWRMPLYQITTGHSTEVENSDLQLRSAALINTSARRRTAAALTATAALTPWIMNVLSLTFDLRPIARGTQTGLPVWGFAILGLADAIRASTLAIRFWTRSMLRHRKKAAVA